MSGSRVLISWLALSTRVTSHPSGRRPRPSPGRCSRRRPRPPTGTVRRAGVVEERLGVVERLDAADVVEVDAREVRARRAGAGGDVQLVEVDGDRALTGVVAHLDACGRPGRCSSDLVPQPHVDAVLSRNSAGVRTTRSSSDATSPATRYGMPHAE